jgi:hypothetical protein
METCEFIRSILEEAGTAIESSSMHIERACVRQRKSITLLQKRLIRFS